MLLSRMRLVLLGVIAASASALAASTEGDADKAYTGAYRLESGQTIIITPSDEATLRYRLEDGRTGRLYPRSRNEYYSGEGWAEREPVIATVSFEPGPQGALEFKYRNQPTMMARRLELPRQAGRFASLSHELYGELYLPPDSKPHALVVLAFGSGREAATRYNYLQYLLPLHGIATFVFDKRGTGYSTGVFTADFSALADDTIAAVAHARKLVGSADVSVGVLGESQGGWVAPLVASRIELDFVISSYGLAISPLDEDREEVMQELRAKGYGQDVLKAARRLTDITHRVLLSRFTQGLPELEQFKREHAGAKWLKEIEGDFTGPLVRTPPSELPVLIKEVSYDMILDYDAEAALQRVTVPMLWVVAGKDTEAPSAPTLTVLRKLQKNQTQLDIAIFPTADHGMIEVEERGGNKVSLGYSPGYWNLLAHWIRTQTLAGKFGNAVLEADPTVEDSKNGNAT